MTSNATACRLPGEPAVSSRLKRRGEVLPNAEESVRPVVYGPHKIQRTQTVVITVVLLTLSEALTHAPASKRTRATAALEATCKGRRPSCARRMKKRAITREHWIVYRSLT